METSKCIISKVAEKEGMTGIEGHPGITAYLLLHPGKGSLNLTVAFGEVEPGGGINPHYHIDCRVFDHAYYIISGDILFSIGDQEQRVGANTLICHPSSEVHSMKNVGSDAAKYLLIYAIAEGETMGQSVYLE